MSAQQANFIRTRGVLYVHSSPRALCTHLEWAVGRVLGSAASFEWTPQPAQRGTLRAEFAWEGDIMTGAALASALRGWDELRYEVVQDATAVSDGARYSHTPGLGIRHSPTDTAGNVVITEDRLRSVMEIAGMDPVALHRELRLALGQAWDDELEPFRRASDENPVRWLHSSVG